MSPQAIPVQRLNHAVLFVKDAVESAEFYKQAFGFEVVQEQPGAVFLRAAGSDNHHDLGLFTVGDNPVPRGSIGLYHLAWQVPSIAYLATAKQTLLELDAYVGESDHGATKSIYGHDPNGIEFEIMWLLPRDEWGQYAEQAVVEPLDLDAEIRAHS